MANRLITLRLGNKLLKEIDTTLKKSSFENRTEFIRHSVRAMLKELGDGTIEIENEKPSGKKGKQSEEMEESIDELKYVR